MAWLRVPQPASAGNKKNTACACATCPAEGKEFLPMIAVHITHEHAYHQILNEG